MFERATPRQRRLLFDMTDVSDAEQSGDVASIVQSTLLALIPGDLALLNDIHLTRSTAVVEPVTQLVRDEDLPALKLLLDEHPAIAEYKCTRGPLLPQRITDVVDSNLFTQSRIYQETFLTLGAHFQLTIPVSTRDGVYRQAWSINRSTSDFSDAEVTLATNLQSMLGLIGPTYFQSNASASANRGGLVPKKMSESTVVHAAEATVTIREGEILQCISRGWTADRTANFLKISPLTVRTHLRNAYAKLGVSDRMLAVERARKLGII